MKEYKGRIESILHINNDLIKLKSASPCDKQEIKIVKNKMKETVKKLLNLRKND